MTPTTYVPGPHTVVVGDRAAALLALAPDHGLVAGVLEVVLGPEPHLDEVLEVLVSQGLRTVTDFVLAEVSDAGVRVVVRGDHRAEVAGEQVVGAGLWVDRSFPRATSVRLLGPDAPGAVRLPVAGGVVLASAVDLGEPGAAASDPHEDAPRPEASEEGAEQPASEVEPGQPAPEEEPGQSVLEEEPGQPGQPAPEEAAAAEDAAPDFDHLFGATQHPAPTPPAVPDLPRPELPQPGVPEARAAGETLPSPLTGPVVDLPPLVQPPAPVPPGGVFIDAFPWNEDGSPMVPMQPPAPPAVAPAVPMPAPVPPVPPADGPPPASRPEMTIDRDQLREHGGALGPTVVAARCAQGHLSPAYAGACRVCGQALPPQEAFEAPRPPLGVLRLQNGDTVLLDRGAILGRNPRLPEGWTGEQPNLVQIHDPDRDISSQHLEVRLDFWHVLLRDLGSTNGTEVLLPGSEPVALRPNDAMAIEPGTRIRLAGVFEVTFEVVG